MSRCGSYSSVLKAVSDPAVLAARSIGPLWLGLPSQPVLLSNPAAVALADRLWSTTVRGTARKSAKRPFMAWGPPGASAQSLARLSAAIEGGGIIDEDDGAGLGGDGDGGGGGDGSGGARPTLTGAPPDVAPAVSGHKRSAAEALASFGGFSPHAAEGESAAVAGSAAAPPPSHATLLAHSAAELEASLARGSAAGLEAPKLQALAMTQHRLNLQRLQILQQQQQQQQQQMRQQQQQQQRLSSSTASAAFASAPSSSPTGAGPRPLLPPSSPQATQAEQSVTPAQFEAHQRIAQQSAMQQQLLLQQVVAREQRRRHLQQMQLAQQQEMLLQQGARAQSLSAAAQSLNAEATVPAPVAAAPAPSESNPLLALMMALMPGEDGPQQPQPPQPGSSAPAGDSVAAKQRNEGADEA